MSKSTLIFSPRVIFGESRRNEIWAKAVYNESSGPWDAMVDGVGPIDDVLIVVVVYSHSSGNLFVTYHMLDARHGVYLPNVNTIANQYRRFSFRPASLRFLCSAQTNSAMPSLREKGKDRQFV